MVDCEQSIRGTNCWDTLYFCQMTGRGFFRALLTQCSESPSRPFPEFSKSLAFKTRLSAKFLINIFALSLALKQGLEATRKWPIGFLGRSCSTEVINKKRFDSPRHRCIVFFFFFFREKPLESMSVDEIENEIAKKPQPAPRTHKREPEKPVEEMSIDEMMKVAEEPSEENGSEVKSPREIVDSSDEVLCMDKCY